MNGQSLPTTEEFARNPNPEVRIACTECRKEYALDEVLHERAMPAPHNTVTEGYLKCPHCGTERHSYYMTELLRFRQMELKKTLEEWHNTKLRRIWTRYTIQQKKFQEIFDRTQKKCREVFEKDKAA